MRLIDADELRKTIKEQAELCRLLNNDAMTEYANILEFGLCKIINNAITVNTQHKWIPCSERLPKEETEVLGTDDHGCIRHVVKDKCGLYEFATYEEMMHINIVAWQPLPEPWKE